jgi:hypothetical protein
MMASNKDGGVLILCLVLERTAWEINLVDFKAGG